MFNIIDCKLTVKDGSMKAIITLSGTGYSKLYMGTGEEAAKASEKDYINYVANNEGKYTYEVPVEALDKGINCAAFSPKSGKWFDRVITFESKTLPQDAFIRM